MMTSFKHWIHNVARVSHTPAGEFVRDSRFVRDLPDCQSFDELRRFLVDRDACPQAHKAATVVWRHYRQWLARQAETQPDGTLSHHRLP